MPEAAIWIKLNAPWGALDEILGNLARDCGYRCEVDKAGKICGSKRIDAQVLRGRICLLHELEIECFEAQRDTTEDELAHDRSSWREKDVIITVRERNCTWSYRKCLEELDLLNRSLKPAYERWEEANQRWLADSRYGGARWASRNDLHGRYLSNDVVKGSFVVGAFPDVEDKAQIISVPPDERVRHVLVCGPT